MTTQRLIAINNEKGLHARASAKFVELVENYDADAWVSKDGDTVAGDSIMGLLMLAASNGTQIHVKTEGPQDEALADALEQLIKGRFGEDR